MPGKDELGRGLWELLERVPKGACLGKGHWRPGGAGASRLAVTQASAAATSAPGPG